MITFDSNAFSNYPYQLNYEQLLNVEDSINGSSHLEPMSNLGLPMEEQKDEKSNSFNGGGLKSKTLSDNENKFNYSNNTSESSIHNPKKTKKIFNIEHKKRKAFFTKKEDNPPLFQEEKKFLKRKRSKIRKKGKDRKDNMRVKIKRGFFNFTLIRKLNRLLADIGSNKYFENFPAEFVSKVGRKINKKILDKTLRQLFEDEKIYGKLDPTGLEKFRHNLQVVQSEIKNRELKNVLDKTFRLLYEEYLNSDEFKVEEINRLRKNKMKDDYIEKYIYLSKHLIQFFDN